MTEIHGSGSEALQSYFCSTKNNQCWETRGLGNDMLQMEDGVRKNRLRDFTQYVNKNGWAAVANKLKS